MKKKLLSFKKRIIKHDITGISAQLSYFLFLSLFPFLILLYTVFGFFSLSIQELLTPLYEMMPNSDTIKIIDSFVQDSAKRADFSNLPIPLILIVFSASKSLHALENYMIKAYNVKETRGYFKRRVFNAFYLIIIIIMLIINSFLPILN
ncbi:MAG: YhjD/YihY/BrkB family envelope integrity protein, partial [Fusobacteriota bacterium]